jgi:hypothetical protein
MAEQNIVQGLFGMTPESYQEQRDAAAYQRAAAFGQMSPMESARTSIFYGANQLGNAVGGMLGAEDPQMRLISQRNALAKQFDLTDVEGLAKYASALQQAGDTQGALGIASELRNVRAETSRQALQQAQAGAYTSLEEERKRAGLEKLSTTRARMQQLMDNGIAKTMDEAQAIASNETTYSEAIGLSKLSPAARAEKAMFSKAEQLYPNDPIAQYQYVESIKQGTKPHTDAEIRDIAEVKQGNVIVQSKLGRTDEYLNKVSGPKPSVYFGPISNIKAWAESTGFLGEPSENTKAQDDVRSYLTEGVNGVLNAAKGVQAKDDAIRAQKQIEGYLKLNSNAGAEQALKRLKQAQQDVLASNDVYLQSRVRQTPTPPNAQKSSGAPGGAIRSQELLNRASPEQRRALGLSQ